MPQASSQSVTSQFTNFDHFTTNKNTQEKSPHKGEGHPLNIQTDIQGTGHPKKLHPENIIQKIQKESP